MPYSKKVAQKASIVNNIDANIKGKAGLPYIVGRSSWTSIFFTPLPGMKNASKRGYNQGGEIHNSTRPLGMLYNHRMR